MSTEGWKEPQEGSPADPRWQSVYVVNTKNPDEFYIVEYPISRYPKAPKEGLYGVSAVLSLDERFLFTTLYGFKDEGGGLWVVDLSEENFHTRPDAFSRIVPWDHALSWMILRNETKGASKSMSVFLTGKEVADDFAMTANFVRIKNAGLNSVVEHQERILRMVGWNPVPFAVQRLSEDKFKVAVETDFNYESSLLPRARGVYIVPVDTSQYE